MNVPSLLLWGPLATVVMTTVESAAQGLGLTRMSMPFLLGTMVTPNRDRAGVLGFLMHLVNGIVFAFIYALIFDRLGATWWMGLIVGLVHSLFILAALMPVLPAIHPRMASETAGPTQVRQLQPAGFFALHYGRRTMLAVFVSHGLYGIVLGAFYEPGPGAMVRGTAGNPALSSLSIQPPRHPLASRL